MEKGMLIVVSGPSGSGKGTILTEVRKDERFYYSVSATTRPPREGEVNGKDYHFMTHEEFEDLIDTHQMLEHAQYLGNYYGTMKQPIEENLAQGKHVLLEIDVQGALQIRSQCPDALFVFIAPPSLSELRRRLIVRGTEPASVIDGRGKQAEWEMTFADQYDHTIVNDEVTVAVKEFFETIDKFETLRKSVVQ